MSGWTYRGWDAQGLAPAAELYLFEAAPAQTSLLPVASILGRNTTAGTAFIRVADFNQDGTQDVLIAGHNESPHQATATNLLLNRGLRFFQPAG